MVYVTKEHWFMYTVSADIYSNTYYYGKQFRLSQSHIGLENSAWKVWCICCDWMTALHEVKKAKNEMYSTLLTDTMQYFTHVFIQLTSHITWKHILYFSLHIYIYLSLSVYISIVTNKRTDLKLLDKRMHSYTCRPHTGTKWNGRDFAICVHLDTILFYWRYFAIQDKLNASPTKQATNEVYLSIVHNDRFCKSPYITFQEEYETDWWTHFQSWKVYWSRNKTEKSYHAHESSVLEWNIRVGCHWHVRACVTKKESTWLRVIYSFRIILKHV